MPTIEQQLQRYGQYLDEAFESGEASLPPVTPPGRSGRVLAGAAIVIVIAVVAGVLALRPDPAPTPVTAGRATVALVPRPMPKGWGVVSTQDFTFRGFPPAAVLGPADAAPDPRSLVVASVMSGVENLKDLLTTEVQGHPAMYDASGPGSTLQWDVGAKDVALHAGSKISEVELRAIAEGTILERDGSLTFDHLPEGWAKRFVSQPGRSWPTTTFAMVTPGLRYDVSTLRDARPGDELGIVAPTRGEAVEVRGHDGIMARNAGGILSLRWIETEGVIVTIVAQGVGPKALVRFAAGLVAADPAAWSTFKTQPRTFVFDPTTTTSPSTNAPGVALLGAVLSFDGDTGPLHLADGPIQLVLDDRVVATRTAAELADRSGWRLPDGRSVLDHLGGNTSHSVGAGPLRACGAVAGRPTGLADASWAVADPGSIDACSQWYGIGVFVRAGRIVAIALYDPH